MSGEKKIREATPSTPNIGLGGDGPPRPAAAGGDLPGGSRSAPSATPGSRLAAAEPVGGIAFLPVERAVLTAGEAAEYLGLDSTRSLERLVERGRLTPLRITKANVYARVELDDFILRELDQERRLRGVADSQAECRQPPSSYSR